MADTPKRGNSILQFALIFAIVYLGSQFLLRTFFPQKPEGGGNVQLQVANTTLGHYPVMTVQNSTASGVTVASHCPQPPVDVFAVQPAAGTGETLTPIVSSETAVPCDPASVSVSAGGSAQISLAPWKYSMFGKAGLYEVRLPVENGPGTQTIKTRFMISEPSALTKLFRTLITKPFLNLLIFFASWLPDHNLGVAIIVLTLLVKLLLYFPTQHALEGQKKMQLLQPKMDELKRKYPDDPRKVQEETVKLWKEYKVNPFQSCLPTLVQFPILIGLFYVIRDGSILALSREFIYPVYQHLSWAFGTSFLGLNLLKPEVYVMPALLVILQFLQMKLTFAISDRKKARQQKVIDVKKKDEPASSSMLQQRMMMYLLPLMIGFFALKFPSAVAIYWGVSTLFAIGQQIVVNREHLSVKA